MRDRLLADLPVTERRLDVDGVDTLLLEGGNGAPVVLLHGMGSFAAEWGRVIPQLVRSHPRRICRALNASELRAVDDALALILGL